MPLAMPLRGPLSPQVYSSPGTYSFIVPLGVTSVSISASGGAGGGASGWTDEVNNKAGTFYVPEYGGDGGSAASATKTLSVTPGETLTVVVGAGGAGGAAPGGGVYDFANSGSTGTDSTVTQSAVVVARADAGSGGSRFFDGAGGTTAASVGDTTTAGVAGAGGAGGFGNTSAGTAGVSGSVTISW